MTRIDLKTPEKPGATIKRIAGSIEVVAAIRRESAAFHDGDNAPRQIGAVTLAVTWNAPNDGIDIRLKVPNKAIPEKFDSVFETFELRFGNAIFTDEMGNRLDINTSGGGGHNYNTHYEMNTTYAPTPDQRAALRKGRLTVTLPTRFKTLTFPFSFENIPYPK